MEDAIIKNDIDTVKYLLEQGYDPNSKTATDTPLIFICENLDILNLLLDFGADPKIVDEYGFRLDEYCDDENEMKILKKERNTINISQTKVIKYNETLRLKQRRAKTLRRKITKEVLSD
jgi:ankyrin repeat protein